MRFGSIGSRSAYQKYVAEATGNGDYNSVNKLLSTASAVMLVLSVVGLVPVSLFSNQLAQPRGSRSVSPGVRMVHFHFGAVLWSFQCRRCIRGHHPGGP